MHKFTLIFSLAFCAASTAFAEGDYDNGKKLVKSWGCTTCHGLTGNTTGPKSKRKDAISIPLLAGQPAIYLNRTMNQFKTRARVDDNKRSRMSRRMQALSAQDIEDIAAYYSAQKRY